MVLDISNSLFEENNPLNIGAEQLIFSRERGAVLPLAIGFTLNTAITPFSITIISTTEIDRIIGYKTFYHFSNFTGGSEDYVFSILNVTRGTTLLTLAKSLDDNHSTSNTHFWSTEQISPLDTLKFIITDGTVGSDDAPQGILSTIEFKVEIYYKKLKGFDGIYESYSPPSPLLTNLLSYFKLDIDNASQLDSTGTNDATVTGAIYTADGKINGGYNFDGTGDSIITDANTGIIGAGTRTITAWAKRSNITTAPVIFVIGDLGVSDMFGFYLRANINLQFFSSANDYDTGEDINDTDWHFYAATYDGTTVRTYLDGSPTATPSSVKALTTDDSSLYIGVNAYNGGEVFVGTIDEVGLWNRQLSDAEILQLWNGGTGLTYPF